MGNVGAVPQASPTAARGAAKPSAPTASQGQAATWLFLAPISLLVVLAGAATLTRDVSATPHAGKVGATVGV
jgi:hypothetical protein